MNTIRIGGDSRTLEDAEESWIAQQIANREREGQSVCIEVVIKTGTLDIRLGTPGCGSGGGSGRAPRPEEAEIIQIWEKHKLTSNDFSGGNVIAFIKQLRRHV